MDFVNNWSRPITLAAGATSLALDLPDGSYRLTLADKAAGATRWEIIDASVASGTAALTRAQEGTMDQAWPEGSVIYCSLTAGTLAQFAAPAAPSRSPVVLVGASRTLTLADEGAYLKMTIGDVELTVPSDAEVAWPDGAEITFAGWGAYSIIGAPVAGDFVMFMFGDSANNYIQSGSEYAVITIKRVGVDTWVASGDFMASAGPIIA
ncbi:hypothetical protein EGI97_12810 [Stutzerimonas xanthomarina]|nr:hypothetical protein EGI97_12810 [Stutzerimonas xanthomarina]